jgi:hypothetical protein
MFTSQSGNTAGGDIIGGDQNKTIYQIITPQSPLTKLYEKFRESNNGTQIAAQIADNLQHYCAVDTDGDIRGLEAKLVDASRKDLLRPATLMKESATKLIMKWQTSGVAQDILTVILSELYTAFTLEVTPAIEAAKSRQEVDSLIKERVIDKTAAMLGDNDLNLTSHELLGLLFFLGGNCHIRWDKC